MIISCFPKGVIKIAGKLPKYVYTGESELIEEDGGWKIRFLTSGTLTVTSNDMDVDIFLVGGGGGGGGGSNAGGSYTGFSYYAGSGGGGGGGYTNTVLNKTLEKGVEYEIVVGAGGAGGAAVESVGEASNGASGGDTSFGNDCVAAGGKGGAASQHSNSQTANAVGVGGNGGSGGGGGAFGSGRANGGSGGENGGNGNKGKDFGYGGTLSNAGTGQGSTTAEFGEETGVLYAGGGGAGQVMNLNSVSSYAWEIAEGGEGGGGDGGCYQNGAWSLPTAGENNTGGGGGGGYACQYGGSYESAGADGGSGIVIIRNTRT